MYREKIVDGRRISGKTHIAGSLGIAACTQGRTVRFFSVKAK
ncbi:MAG: ATP-binding protein [Sedimentisphaerales bacterium]|nr:ATP-binding protein [Sedimentisphaerales bacterium]